jgi:hypothetical protein
MHEVNQGIGNTRAKKPCLSKGHEEETKNVEEHSMGV